MEIGDRMETREGAITLRRGPKGVSLRKGRAEFNKKCVIRGRVSRTRGEMAMGASNRWAAIEGLLLIDTIRDLIMLRREE